MTNSTKIVFAAGVIALMSLAQLGLSQQLMLETASSVFTLRSPILVVLAIIQVVFGLWALSDVSQKIAEDKKKTAPKHRKSAK